MHKTFSEHWLSQDLSAEAAQKLYAMGDIIDVDADDVLIEADVPNESLFLILEGAVKSSYSNRVW